MNDQVHEILNTIGRFNLQHSWWHRFQIKQLLKDIEDQEIIEQVGMAELPQIINLLYYKHGGKFDLLDIGGDCMLRFGKTNVANASYLPTFIHFISIENSVLKIEGNVSWPTVLDRYFRFFIIVNGTKHCCELKDANLDLYNGKDKYEVRRVFNCNLELQMNQALHIQFCYECNGIDSISRKINAMRFCPVADCIEGQYAIEEDWMMQVVENMLVVTPFTDKEKENKEIAFQNEILHLKSEFGEWAISIRRKYFEQRKNKEKPLWLFMDRANRADDNAEVLFDYMQKYKEIETVFVIDKQSKDYARLKTIGKVVDLYSEEHYLAALLADYVISSQCNGVVENPFWDNAEFFRDLYHKPKIIFLQHGVIKDDMSPTLNRYNTNFTGFITSTRDEYQSILEYPYFYGEREVWCTGLPIFDKLEDKRQKIILVMPTWRQELMHQEWNPKNKIMEWIPNEDVSSSVYFRTYYKFLHNEKLQKQCRKYGYKIAFKSHPLLEPYLRPLADNDNIVWWGSEKSYTDAFEEGSILITDYSSVAFEFAYLRKPIVYYQFDEKAFFEKHTYHKGYFDYRKKGFGEVKKQESELVDTVCNYLAGGCQLSEIYRERIDDAYTQLRGSTCEKTYKKCRGEEEDELYK